MATSAINGSFATFIAQQQGSASQPTTEVSRAFSYKANHWTESSLSSSASAKEGQQQTCSVAAKQLMLAVIPELDEPVESKA